jgi:hypothetical protein
VISLSDMVSSCITTGVSCNPTRCNMTRRPHVGDTVLSLDRSSKLSLGHKCLTVSVLWHAYLVQKGQHASVLRLEFCISTSSCTFSSKTDIVHRPSRCNPCYIPLSSVTTCFGYTQPSSGVWSEIFYTALFGVCI